MICLLAIPRSIPLHHSSHSGFTVAYRARGCGEPLLLLHGSTRANHMLQAELEYYLGSEQDITPIQRITLHTMVVQSGHRQQYVSNPPQTSEQVMDAKHDPANQSTLP